MCAVEDAEPWKVCHESHPKARKQHTCSECRRPIDVGEQHLLFKGVTYDWPGWQSWRICAHCEAAGVWMVAVCSGYLLGNLLDELVEHWYEGFRSIEFARLIVGVRRRWHGGRDPVPTDVRELAARMMREQVAA